MARDFGAIVSRLQELVPAGFRVNSLAPGIVAVGFEETTWGIVDVTQALARGDIEGAAWGLLDYVQDNVAEQLTTPWPGTGSHMPAPMVRDEGGALRAWYGDENHVVLNVGTF